MKFSPVLTILGLFLVLSCISDAKSQTTEFDQLDDALRSAEDRQQTEGSLAKLSEARVSYIDVGITRTALDIYSLFRVFENKVPSLTPIYVTGYYSIESNLIAMQLYVSQGAEVKAEPVNGCTDADREIVRIISDGHPRNQYMPFDFANNFVDRSIESNPAMGKAYWAVKRALGLEIVVLSFDGRKQLRNCFTAL